MLITDGVARVAYLLALASAAAQEPEVQVAAENARQLWTDLTTEGAGFPVMPALPYFEPVSGTGRVRQLRLAAEYLRNAELHLLEVREIRDGSHGVGVGVLERVRELEALIAERLEATDG